MRAGVQSRVASPCEFAERVGRLLDRVEYRRARSRAELDAIVRLRYEAYLHEGAISPNPSGRLEDAYDDVDHVYNFGIFIDGELASALRLHTLFHSGQESPALESFGDVLRPRLRVGKLIIDPNRFVADHRLARLHPELPYVTLRPTYLACVFFGIDLVTMTVRAEHQAFYRRGFFANPICPPRPYPLLSKPIGLLLVDFVKDADRILARHPYWSSSEAERRALFGEGPTSRRSEIAVGQSHALYAVRDPDRPSRAQPNLAAAIGGSLPAPGAREANGVPKPDVPWKIR